MLSRDEMDVLGQNLYPKLTFRTEADGEVALTPKGWKQRFYKLNEGPFRFSKWTLELSDGLLLEEAHLLEGSLRVDGKIGEGRLFIGILSKDEDYRLLSARGSGELLTISYDGSEWDMVADAVGTAITLHAAPDVAEKILGKRNIQRLQDRMIGPNGKKSLLLPITQEAEILANMMRRFIRLSKEETYFENRLDRLNLVHDMLTVQSSFLINNIFAHEPLNEKITRERRIMIAKEIENILWTNRGGAEGPLNSLDDFADHFQITRRSIQLAIQETFNSSFTELRNSIKLHQARDALREIKDHGSVSQVARMHGFEHLGRFSSQFKRMFGRLPSDEVRKDKT